VREAYAGLRRVHGQGGRQEALGNLSGELAALSTPCPSALVPYGALLNPWVAGPGGVPSSIVAPASGVLNIKAHADTDTKKASNDGFAARFAARLPAALHLNKPLTSSATWDIGLISSESHCQ